MVKIDSEKLINILNEWIENCEKQTKVFQEKEMTNAEMSSEGMRLAYVNVKNFVEKIVYINEKLNK